MNSSGGGIGSTLTAGIQDIAGILPLLGTEQCSEQISSAITRGYLYAASTPMSIFGSLGVVSAGFKTLVACISFGDHIEGAKILANMGFEPKGENLSLIMVEAGKGKNAGRYIIETRMDELIKELNIDKNRITGVSHKSAAWNVKMIASTALLCALGITPYIYLNQVPNSLSTSTTWVFPVLRTTGGFMTATFIQLLIQRRIISLSDEYVKRDRQRNTDVEAASGMKKYQIVARSIAPTWLLLCLLLIGLVASIVGYVGCFSVVQNSKSTIGPVSWLCLEAGLSVIRLAIWAWNPPEDDAPPLEITLELDKYEHKPLPTCNKDNEEILEYKVLPLTRARDFLKIITLFAGLIEPFSSPDLSLYYTLTRKRPSKKSAKLGERTLYITVFDHKERTTRVYTQDNDRDTFYSTKLDAPLVDVGHFLLEVEIDAKIDPKGDPVSRDTNNLDLLRKHYRSILEFIQYRLGANSNVTKPYAIENSWTMKAGDTVSALQRLREENGDGWKTVVEIGKEEERKEESRPICDYFMHSSIERERRSLDEKFGKWIAHRMEMITKETKERFQDKTRMGMPVEYRVNKQAVEYKPALATKSPGQIELMLAREQYLMELLLVYEVNEWELLFWEKFKAFLDHIGNDRVEEKERLTREWRANCWKRLNPQIHAAEKRLDEDDGYFVGLLGERWASTISQFFDGAEKPNSISLSDLRREMEPLDDEIRLRLEKEIEETEFRLKRGSKLGQFDQFWDDDSLFECRYSRSKWLYLSQFDVSAPLEIYSHALKGNKNIIHITFSDFSNDSDVNRFQATLCDLPWMTSISRDSFERLPPIHCDRSDLIFVKSIDDNLITFAEKIRPKLDLFSTYFFTDAEGSDMYSGKLANNARVLVSFVAPTSGKGLILRLKHSGEEDGSLQVTLGSQVIQLNPLSKSTLTIDDMTLYPIQDRPSESHRLSFVPGIRNDIVIQFGGPFEETSLPRWAPRHGHFLLDIDLLDEAGLEYKPHSASLSILSN